MTPREVRPFQAPYLPLQTSRVSASPDPEIKNILTGVLTYYSRTKQIGHTRCLFSGIGYMHHDMTTRPSVVAINKSLADTLSPGNGVGLLSFATPEGTYSLPRKPLLWDNSDIEYVMSRSLNRIEALEHELAEAKAKLARSEAPEDTGVSSNGASLTPECLVAMRHLIDGEGIIDVIPAEDSEHE